MGTPTREVSEAAVTLLAEMVLVPGTSQARPVVLPISFGAPMGPETDVEPVNLRWSHHGVVKYRQSVFLPGPASVSSSPARAGAIAQIVRTPSLMQ